MARMPAGDRREQLIDAAIEVMTSEGIEAATTRRIADQAGVAVGVLYYCFGTKENLYRQVVAKLVDDIREIAIGRLDARQDLRASLSRATEAFLGDVETRPQHHVLTYEIVTYALRREGSAELAAWLYECYDSAAQEMLEVFAAAADVRWTVPIDVVARLLTALNDGITLAQLVDGDGARARRVFALAIDSVLRLAAPVQADAVTAVSEGRG